MLVLTRKNREAIVISHDMTQVFKIADLLTYLYFGVIEHTGPELGEHTRWALTTVAGYDDGRVDDTHPAVHVVGTGTRVDGGEERAAASRRVVARELRRHAAVDHLGGCPHHERAGRARARRVVAPSSRPGSEIGFVGTRAWRRHVFEYADVSEPARGTWKPVGRG